MWAAPPVQPARQPPRRQGPGPVGHRRGADFILPDVPVLRSPTWSSDSDDDSSQRRQLPMPPPQPPLPPQYPPYMPTPPYCPNPQALPYPPFPQGRPTRGPVAPYAAGPPHRQVPPPQPPGAAYGRAVKVSVTAPPPPPAEPARVQPMVYNNTGSFARPHDDADENDPVEVDGPEPADGSPCRRPSAILHSAFNSFAPLLFRGSCDSANEEADDEDNTADRYAQDAAETRQRSLSDDVLQRRTSSSSDLIALGSVLAELSRTAAGGEEAASRPRSRRARIPSMDSTCGEPKAVDPNSPAHTFLSQAVNEGENAGPLARRATRRSQVRLPVPADESVALSRGPRPSVFGDEAYNDLSDEKEKRDRFRSYYVSRAQTRGSAVGLLDRSLYVSATSSAIARGPSAYNLSSSAFSPLIKRRVSDDVVIAQSSPTHKNAVAALANIYDLDGFDDSGDPTAATTAVEVFVPDRTNRAGTQPSAPTLSATMEEKRARFRDRIGGARAASGRARDPDSVEPASSADPADATASATLANSATDGFAYYDLDWGLHTAADSTTGSLRATGAQPQTAPRADILTPLLARRGLSIPAAATRTQPRLSVESATAAELLSGDRPIRAGASAASCSPAVRRATVSDIVFSSTEVSMPVPGRTTKSAKAHTTVAPPVLSRSLQEYRAPFGADSAALASESSYGFSPMSPPPPSHVQPTGRRRDSSEFSTRNSGATERLSNVHSPLDGDLYSLDFTDLFVSSMGPAHSQTVRRSSLKSEKRSPRRSSLSISQNYSSSGHFSGSRGGLNAANISRRSPGQPAFLLRNIQSGSGNGLVPPKTVRNSFNEYNFLPEPASPPPSTATATKKRPAVPAAGADSPLADYSFY